MRDRLMRLLKAIKYVFDYVKNLFGKLIKIFYSPASKGYKEISNASYIASFGLKKNGNGDLVKIDEKDTRINEAFKRACENRDFEINKFWSRAAYFWGFIVLIFGAYFKIIEYSCKAENSQKEFYSYIEVCLLCMGIVFSVSWFLVILGSKHWQENWEIQIDKLEDFISGPLYKTIYYKRPFYSVSKINLTLSLYVIIIWVGLLVYHVKEKMRWESIDIMTLSVFGLTLLFLVSLIFGYSRKRFANKSSLIVRRS